MKKCEQIFKLKMLKNLSHKMLPHKNYFFLKENAFERLTSSFIYAIIYRNKRVKL